jgi:hypothetical protein
MVPVLARGIPPCMIENQQQVIEAGNNPRGMLEVLTRCDKHLKVGPTWLLGGLGCWRGKSKVPSPAYAVVERRVHVGSNSRPLVVWQNLQWYW